MLLEEFDAFLLANESWLNDYCLFMAEKDAHEGKCWIDWDDEMTNPTEEQKDVYKRQNLITQLKILHNHAHFVIPIFSSSDHIQTKINFRKCFFSDFSHALKTLSLYTKYIIHFYSIMFPKKSKVCDFLQLLTKNLRISA